MNIEQTKHTLLYFPPRKSIMLLGNHGLGKSSVVAQTAAQASILFNKPFAFIDFRLAQCEVGDLIGMMRHVDETEIVRSVFVNGVKTEEKVLTHNVTIHDVADWFPTDPNSCGFLFLDELFLAPRDLQNAIMELALDYRFHFQELPIGWRVISASNDDLDIYPGTLPSPAMMDRWFKIDFKPTIQEVLTHLEEKKVHPIVLSYMNKMPDSIMPKPMVDKVTPTPRSWESLSETIQYMISLDKDPLSNPEYMVFLAKGYIGDETAISFADYVKNHLKVYSAETILNKYSIEIETDIKAMEVPELGYYTNRLVAYAKSNKLSEKQKKNLFSYLKAIPKEVAIGFWTQFSKECRAQANDFYSNKEVETYIYGMLNKHIAVG